MPDAVEQKITFKPAKIRRKENLAHFLRKQKIQNERIFNEQTPRLRLHRI